ncbi:AAA family ATPase [Nonomuraea typhae]|uniref:AAA family ATPase n=1 Tax=Nonomuraea typhae TaxID=2603600 RepID=A0ABW7YQJ1_9ACTN
MREGVRARIAQYARSAGRQARTWTPPVLLSLLCAGAFGPLLAGAGLAGASLAALTAVGGNVLTDMVKAAIERVRGPSDTEAIQDELERAIRETLEAGGARAESLRAEIATLFRQNQVADAALEAAAETDDRELEHRLAAGLSAVSAQFAEFGFLTTAILTGLARIEAAMDQQRAVDRLSLDLLYQHMAAIAEVRASVLKMSGTRDAPPGTVDRRRWTRGCPYPGLAPFTQDRAEVFYGREKVTGDLIEALARRLHGTGLIMLTGASGVGKSSLLQAGLLPALKHGRLSAESAGWPTAVVRDPTLTGLAEPLAALAGLRVLSVCDDLAKRPGDAGLLVGQAVHTDARRRGRAEGTDRLILIVDQFEQAFTLMDGDQRKAFVTALDSAAASGQALVVIAVRGDHIDRCAAYPTLAEAVRDSLFVVEPMGEQELRHAIAGPADAAGLEFERRLIDTILDELRTAAGDYAGGVLPLLSQAMRATWDHQEGNRLTRAGYERGGGIANAVLTSAESVYDSLAPAPRELTRHLFLLLIAAGEDGRLARLRRTDTDLREGCATYSADDVGTVLAAFAKARLMVRGEGSTEIAHDVLLRAWPRLRDWLESDRADRVLYNQLIHDATAWVKHRQDPAFLYRGTRLADTRAAVERWLADPERYPGVVKNVKSFLEAGRRAAVRNRRYRGFAFTVMAVLLVFALVGAVLAGSYAADVAVQRDEAVSRQLAVDSDRLARTAPFTSAMLAAAAWQRRPTDHARHSLLNVLTHPSRGILGSHGGMVSQVMFSADGTRLATAGGGRMQLWDVATRRPAGPAITGFSQKSVVISHDLSTVAGIDAVSRDTISLWDVATRRRKAVIRSRLSSQSEMALSRDGRTLAVCGFPSSIDLWDVTTRRRGARLTRYVCGTGMAFSPDGSTLIVTPSLSYEGALHVWDVLTGRRRDVFFPEDAGLRSALALSPDGRMLATGDNVGGIRLWDASGAKTSPVKLPGHTGSVTSLAFSPDGSTLAGAGTDQSVRLWDLRTARPRGQPLVDTVHPPHTLAFAPDGRTLAVGSGDGTVQFLDTAIYHEEAGTAMRHDYPVHAAAFGPDGRTLVSGGDDGLVRVWDAATHRPRGRPLRWPGLFVSALALSPDRRTLAVILTGQDDMVDVAHLWDVTTGRPLGPPLDTNGRTVDALTFSPDGHRLITVETDSDSASTIQSWQVTTATRLPPLAAARPEATHALAFSPDGRYLATGNASGGCGSSGGGGRCTVYGSARAENIVHVWDARDGRGTRTLRGHRAPINAIAFSPDSHLIATGSGDSPTCHYRDTPRNPCVVVSMSGDNTARLWDTATGRQSGPPLVGHTSPIRSLAFSPDGRFLATASVDGTIRLWDVPGRRQLGEPLTGHSGQVNTVAFSPDGSRLVSGGADGTVRLWNVGLPAGPLLSHVCSIVGQAKLAPQDWAVDGELPTPCS